MHSDAVKDGIRFEKPPGISPTKYYPHCCVCDNEMMVFRYDSKIQYTCKECKLVDSLSDKMGRVEESKPIKEKKLANAVKRIERMYGTSGYGDAINAVQESLHTDGWYQSTEEIMVAIELHRRNIPFQHQVKMGRYRVDFMLPEHKIILEVDGGIFHAGEQRKKDQLRDDLIVIALGAEWEVIRISDEMININVSRLVPAITRVHKRRKELKQQNGGLLTEWYNRKMG